MPENADYVDLGIPSVAGQDRLNGRSAAALFSLTRQVGLTAWRGGSILFDFMADHVEFIKRRARKAWPCQAPDHVCSGSIEPGDRYVQVDRGEGRARWTMRYAWACAAVAFEDEFMRALEVQGVLPPRHPTATGAERRFRRVG